MNDTFVDLQVTDEGGRDWEFRECLFLRCELSYGRNIHDAM